MELMRGRDYRPEYEELVAKYISTPQKRAGTA
jgi:hypothetical protein